MAIPPIKVIITGVDHFTKQLGASMQRLNKMGQSMKTVGRNMTTYLTVPVALFGYSTLKAAADFEMSMNRVQNLTSGTTEQMAALSHQARTLGATTKFTAAEAADAMGFLGMAGFSVEKILGSMEGTLNLAAGANMELAQTADIASNILTGYRFEATQMNRVADVMTKTFQRSNTNLEQLGDAMKYVAPVASGMQISFEETAAAIGLLGNAGIQASMAGTTLRGALSKIAAPSREAAAILAKLKIPKSNIINAKGDLISIETLVRELGKAGANTSDLLEIFGERAGPGMAALISQGADSIKNFRTMLEGAGGAAKAAADVTVRGLAGQMKNLKSAFQELQLSIADSGLLKWVTDLVIGLTKFTREVAKVSPSILKFATIFAAIIAVIGPVIWIIGSLITAISSIGGAVASAGGIIALLSNPIGWVVAGVLAIIAVLKLLGMKWSTIFALLLPPLIPLIAIVKVLKKHWGSLIPYFKLIGLAFQKIFETTAESLGPWIKALEFLVELIFKAVEGLMKLGGKLLVKMLPEDIKRKVGFLPAEGGSTGATPVPAGELAQRAATTIGGLQPNVTNIKIEDKVGVKLTTETEEGDVNTEVHRGLAFGGAY